MKGLLSLKICVSCHKQFLARPRQRYCGSQKLRLGCAHKHHLAIMNRWDKSHQDVRRIRFKKYYFNPENSRKNKARAAVNNALALGRLVKRPCEKCSKAKTEAHHYDYNEPLEVIWLCKVHHRELHTEFNRAGISVTV